MWTWSTTFLDLVHHIPGPGPPRSAFIDLVHHVPGPGPPHSWTWSTTFCIHRPGPPHSWTWSTAFCIHRLGPSHSWTWSTATLWPCLQNNPHYRQSGCKHGRGIGPKRQNRCRVCIIIGHRSVSRANTARTFANAVANDYLCKTELCLKQ